MQKFIKEILEKYPQGLEVDISINGVSTKSLKQGQDLVNFITSMSYGRLDKAKALFIVAETKSEETEEVTQSKKQKK